jgi:hypothetical protein
MAVARVARVCVLLLLLAACSPKGPDDTSPRVIPDLPTYDKSACKDVQPYEGGNAISANLSANNPDVETAFNKAFDRADLEAVEQASALQTSIYVMDMGVNVYRIPRQSNQCPMFYALPEVPNNLRTVWDEVAGGAGEGQLAGAYFEICEGNCPEYTMSNPTILVHEAADRWTLVHEMMHHNFNVMRKANPSLESVQRVRQRILAGQTNLEQLAAAYSSAPSRETLTAMADQVYALVGNVYVLLTNTTFEEIAVEHLLLQEAAAGRLKFVSEDSAASAAWYIKLSREDGLRTLSIFDDRLDAIYRDARRNEWRDIMTTVERGRSEVDYIRRKTDGILDDSRRLSSKAQAQIPRGNRSSANGLSPMAMEFIDPGASRAELAEHLHGLDGYDTLQEVTDRMQRLNSLSK